MFLKNKVSSLIRKCLFVSSATSCVNTHRIKLIDDRVEITKPQRKGLLLKGYNGKGVLDVWCYGGLNFLTCTYENELSEFAVWNRFDVLDAWSTDIVPFTKITPFVFKESIKNLNRGDQIYSSEMFIVNNRDVSINICDRENGTFHSLSFRKLDSDEALSTALVGQQHQLQLLHFPSPELTFKVI